MKRTLKGWLFKNHLNFGKPEEKFVRLYLRGSLTIEDVLDRMEHEGTGLRRETLKHALTLSYRIVAELITEGYSVNTGLFHVMPQAMGVVMNAHWDPDRNSVHAAFTEGEMLRDALAEVGVQIQGERGRTMYILGGSRSTSGDRNEEAMAGMAYIVYGRKIKVAGDDASVGITLTDAYGQVTEIPRNQLIINHPSQVAFFVPTHLQEGEYTLTIVTQYTTSTVLLKTPKVASRQITILSY
jgi:hypothetical protein